MDLNSLISTSILYLSPKNMSPLKMLLLKQDSPTEADARKINARCKPSDYQWMLAVPKNPVVSPDVPRVITTRLLKCYRIHYPFSCDMVWIEKWTKWNVQTGLSMAIHNASKPYQYTKNKSLFTQTTIIQQCIIITTLIEEKEKHFCQLK